MKFVIKSSLLYVISGPATILCSLRCSGKGPQTVIHEHLSADRDAQVREIKLGLTSNRYDVATVPTPGDFTLNYEATVQTDHTLMSYSSITDCSIAGLDPDTIPFLFPSRYCQSDLFRKEATELFGGDKGELTKAIAVEKWLRENIGYTSGASDEGTSALETFRNRSGVCRDFAHLGIAFCRALTIPARYATVYAHQLEPRDFHAVFEVFVGGSWHVMDGTGLAPLNGMVRIGTGRDACDAAVATLFGGVSEAGIKVDVSLSSDEQSGFISIARADLIQRQQSILLS